MLSDDDIQRVAIQCGMKIGQHWNKGRMNTSKMRSFARAIEREARRQALEEDVPKYTEGHCRYKKLPGGCPLHNTQCGYPDCDRRQMGG